jgi:hypothetical protein
MRGPGRDDRVKVQAPCVIAAKSSGGFNRSLVIGSCLASNYASLRRQPRTSDRLRTRIEDRLPCGDRHGRRPLLSVRSGCLWELGYPGASRKEGERAVNEAREIGHAATLMFALFWASWHHMNYGAYTEAQSLLDELASLADEKDASLFWKATVIAFRGALFAETGNAPDAVRAITSGMTSLRSTGAALYEPWHLWHLAMA